MHWERSELVAEFFRGKFAKIRRGDDNDMTVDGQPPIRSKGQNGKDGDSEEGREEKREGRRQKGKRKEKGKDR